MGDTSDQRRAHLWVSGRVQGVFFRATTKEEASKRGLTGWVRNAGDGRVEAEVQGQPAAVEELIDECRASPGMAKVDDVQVEDVTVVPDDQGFDVVD